MAWHFDLATDIGGRAEQQDRLEVMAVPDQPGAYLVVLADGMGGQQQGAVAAQTVIDTARLALPALSESDPKRFLTDLCLTAHETIKGIGRQNKTNPASTCTALYVKGDEAYWIHVGDSRLCHFSGETLLASSSDHTVAELLKDGIGEEFWPRPVNISDNRLYMCLGGLNELDPEFGASAVGDNDWFLLCSDGFWNQVGSDEVVQALSKGKSDLDAASELAAIAKQRAGAGGDNLSLALITPKRAVAKKAWWNLF